MSGISAISHLEVKAWAEMTGSMPSYWEVSVLMRMDIAFRAASASNAPISGDAPSAPVSVEDGREVIGVMRMFAARKNG